MSDSDQPVESESVKDKSLTEKVLSVARQGTIGWIQPGLNDWMSFISGPTDPPFSEGQSFKTELPRLFRLLATVGILSGTIVATKDILSSNPVLGVLVLESPAAVEILLVGAIVAIIYYFVLAKAFRVPVTLPQALFTIMLLGLPWLPLTALIHSFASSNISFGTFVEVFWFYLAPIVLVGNFSRGISSICPRCSRWRIRASFVVPILILILGFSLVGTGHRDAKPAAQGESPPTSNKLVLPNR